ncbi:MAG TPA: tetratricopeptide repeat protein [Chloroflexota bacterium]|nr:tetratricopeptide repeat protein [Chloroflexota bacterium]
MSKHFGVSPNNLPLPLNRLIGREREVTAVKGLLVTTRLLTLTGAGGSGKTRLALQVATDLLDEFAHGVWWVELAALSDPLLVPEVVASVIGIPERAGYPVTETLADAIRPKHLLLVLDNCEHLLAACVQLIEALLRTCPQLRVLITSREALAITGETTWLVLPLQVPDTFQPLSIEGLLAYEAVQLFVERARSVVPSFTLTTENASAVVRLCRRLDGMPLAIELAAARIRALSVEQIVARLDDAYRILTGGSRSALPRQQTLRAAMDWSYDLLSAPEQACFRRLAAFSGSFSLEAAEVIGVGESGAPYDVLDVLSSLIEKSLVLVEQRRGEARYRLLEPIRQYGQDKLRKLAEAETVRRTHRDWYAHLAARAEVELLEAQQESWVERLESEHDNLRSALGWSLAHQEAETAAQIGAAIWRFWLLRGHLSEGRNFLQRALAGFSDKNAARAKALNVAAILASLQDDYQAARTLAEESLALSRALAERRQTGYALYILGRLARIAGNYAVAATFFEESLSLFRELGQRHDIALVLSGLALTVLCLGDGERATALCEESLAASRELGDPRGVASWLANLGMIMLARGDDKRAKELGEESLVIRRSLGYKGGCAHSLAILGRIALQQGAYERATVCYKESLTLRQETGEKEGIATALEGLAAVAGMQGQSVSAARLSGSAEALRTLLGAPLTPIDRPSYQQTIAALRAQLGESTFRKAWTEGHAMTLEEAIAEAVQVKARAQSPATLPPAPLETPLTSPSRPNPSGLTAREIDVLRLLTRGLTTTQIAQQLVISPRTADAHLRSIYSKLAVTTRAAATRAALERQLI